MAQEFWKDSPFGENSIFHPNYDQNNRLKTKTRSLSIVYKNCSIDDKYTSLTFEISASELSTFDAEIGVKEIDVWSNATLVPKTKVSIDPKGTKTVTVKYDKVKQKGGTKQFSKANSILLLQLPVMDYQQKLASS